MLPLRGMTVVAIEQAVAAPFATRQLADLGARVIKIERPDGGDFARSYDTTVKGLSSYFVWLNRSKESLTLDLKQPQARSVLDRLLPKADVFVQNLGPGATDRLDLAAVALRAAYPRLIVCSVTGDGGAPPPRSGAHHASIAPYGAFHSRDGEPVYLAVQNPREWTRFCGDVLRRPELADDEQFRTNPARIASRKKLHDEIDRVFC